MKNPDENPRNEASTPKSNDSSPSPSEAEQIIQRAAEEARRLEEKRALTPGVDAPKSTKQKLREVAGQDQERTAVKDRIVRIEDARREKEQVERFIAACGVPVRYRGAVLLDASLVPMPTRDEYLEAFRRLVGLFDHDATLALLGRRGAGKTHMACAVVVEFCRRGRYAVYAEAMDYFIALQESYGDGAKEKASAIEARFLKPSLLVLDAIEERGDTAWNDRMLTRLVNKRYAAELSTVLISNHDQKAFAERVGASIWDRIWDEGGIIECTWKSLRGNLIRQMRDVESA